MCQLMGMNCNVPTDISFSFRGFSARGGRTDEHKDGWGIAFFEGRGCRLFLDSESSAKSAVAELVRNYSIKSVNVIAHIRKATIGNVCLENTHPFCRELWGHYWVFAHNGDLTNFAPELNGPYSPVGTTDSERAFCLVLQSLKDEFGLHPPTAHQLHTFLEKLVPTISSHGPFNFLLSNGEFLVAHCSTRLSYIVRQAPFNKAHLVDEDLAIDFAQVTMPGDRVAVVATAPLTRNETWTTMSKGEIVTFVDGAPVHHFKPPALT